MAVPGVEGKRGTVSVVGCATRTGTPSVNAVSA